MIQPIVEGQGEVEAVPLLLRRILGALGVWDVQVGRPLRSSRHQVVREADLKNMLVIATRTNSIQAIVIILDLDDDCARNLIPNMKRWATETAANVPCAVVLARREYEAWFLASIESLQGKHGILPTATHETNPEAKRGAKEALSLHMPKNRPYREMDHQPAMTAVFDMGMAYRKASSFRKLVSEMCRVLIAMGYQPAIPDDWGSE